MSPRLCQHVVTCVFAIAVTVSVGGCGSGDDAGVSDEELFGDSATTGAASTARSDGLRFDVGGHKLFMSCTGTGAPTVVYLHGSVQKPGDGGSQSAAGIPALLESNHRVCVYDRANVGRSDAVRGPLTGTDSAEDLHALLAAARVPGPYVLLGGSLGGGISDIYAAKYPDDVAGMVLLDSTVPAYLEMYKRLYPPGSGPQPGEWRRETEQLDRLATFREMGKIQGRRPKMPVTYIATTLSRELSPKIRTAIRRAQRAFVHRFTPGRLIVLDVPHYMEPVVPDRIAAEVRRVIAAAQRG